VTEHEVHEKNYWPVPATPSIADSPVGLFAGGLFLAPGEWRRMGDSFLPTLVTPCEWNLA